MIYYPDTDVYSIAPHLTVRDTTPIRWTRDVEGRDGYFLQCDTVANLAIEARIEGDVSWTNLETTPIDLTPYIGIRQRFEFRLTSSAFSADDRIQFDIFCAP